MQVDLLKSKALSLARQIYRRCRVMQWAHGLAQRNHWRELHTRDSCVYGFVNPLAILLDVIKSGSGAPRGSGAVACLESTLASVLGVRHVTTFRSGRNSLRAILRASGIGAGHEVIIPGLTCAVVPYTILHCGARPVYVDIGRDYRMNLEALSAAFSPRTKAIMVQHSFGIPERISEIASLAQQRDIQVIEDCTHVLPGSAYDKKPMGTVGAAAYFSFESGKTISSGWGGAVVTNNDEIAMCLRQMQQEVSPLSRDDNIRISAQLFLTILSNHPDLFAIGNLLRPWLAGKRLVPNPVPAGERRGEPPTELLGRLADIQASLLLRQLKRLSSISERRRACVKAFAERLGGPVTGLPLMWYPLQVRNRDQALEAFRKEQIWLRTWKAPLTPANSDMDRAQYRWGSCPVAEEISRVFIALPTMLKKQDIERVLKVAARHLDIVRVQ